MYALWKEARDTGENHDPEPTTFFAVVGLKVKSPFLCVFVFAPSVLLPLLSPRWVCFGITLISKGLESFTYKRKDRMFLLRTESEDISVACVWWVVPQFNDTPGLVLCLEVKAARRAPPHGLRPLNHGGAFFRAERDGVWVTYERPNEQSAETTWSKKRKERETVNKPFGMAAAQTARMCSGEIIRWCHISQAHGKTSSRVRKWRRGLGHFQAGLHQGHAVCTFLFEKATFRKWHIQQKLCPHWKKTLTWRVLPHPCES